MAEKTISTPPTSQNRPIHLATALISGVLAGQVFEQLWKQTAPRGRDETEAFSRGGGFKEIVIGAAVQGAMFAVIKTVLDRTAPAALRGLDRSAARGLTAGTTR
ncbi:DUF4235 domain-containing protein [Arthrobacter sp. ISL-85]|uniref:DUF4235 domain-containing protein n=1 Tax=Arthrobacter sp. ISL-85 TaxID=2819115 RepID=UPI001BE6DCA1|nr:DUF4235 domain-containing protein [Arthrobacter sp. ISL-85]MBT2566258.1 DUF4235 domain-containing protein [Arthrobacter sp. ISL-85]